MLIIGNTLLPVIPTGTPTVFVDFMARSILTLIRLGRFGVSLLGASFVIVTSKLNRYKVHGSLVAMMLASMGSGVNNDKPWLAKLLRAIRLLSPIWTKSNVS